ncbi:CBS domain-containing membrane protein [Methylomagnum ishizawai]|uniref:CBS domain-containing membrane protein n=1 Tax=Methylomagnum ishizawai TaxID=1760988 RepID=A0A1Y6CZK7_9GAMM|nr:HPP family protein [Methylomagnum ishizawai]SMF95640.1 CBS domain-containing membrane protein [Methylomagnum ishizawai]
MNGDATPGFRKRFKLPTLWPREANPVALPTRLQIAASAGLALYATAWAGGAARPALPMVASMGASAVILFAVPHSPMAGTWAVLGGHLLSGLVGVACAGWIADPWSAAGWALGLSIFAMHSARCLHPPGGATALYAVLGGEGVRALGYEFLLTPLALNVGLLLAFAKLAHRPRPVPQPAPAPAHPPPLERLGLNGADLRAALHDIHAFVDVSEAELRQLYELAANHAYRRGFGEQDCAGIMSRDPVTVEFGTDLEATWALMRRHNIKAIPVIDRGRHVVGIITLTDFFRHAQIERLDGMGGKLRRLLQTTPGIHSRKPEVAGQIMTAPVVSVRAGTPVADLAPLLCGRGIHQIPVVDARDKLVGIVTQSDLIAAMYRNLVPHPVVQAS